MAVGSAGLSFVAPEKIQLGITTNHVYYGKYEFFSVLSDREDGLAIADGANPWGKISKLIRNLVKT